MKTKTIKGKAERKREIIKFLDQMIEKSYDLESKIEKLLYGEEAS